MCCSLNDKSLSILTAVCGIERKIFLTFLTLFIVSSTWAEVVTLLDDTRLTEWEPHKVIGRSLNGFTFNDSHPRVCDVGTNFRNFLVSPIINIANAKALWLNIRYKIARCDELDIQYGSMCTEKLHIHIIPLDNSAEFHSSDLDDENTKIASLVAIGDIVGKYNNPLDLEKFPKMTSARMVIEDHGTCSQILSFKVSYRQCPNAIQAQANFTATAAPFVPRESVSGQCVEGAEGNHQPSYSCKSDGNWDEEDTVIPFCQCKPGYEQDGESCSKCSYNYYKMERGNSRCMPCPENSFSGALGKDYCTCMHNKYRAPDEPKSMPCGGPPSPPRNVTAKVQGTHVTITWQRPLSDGFRRDLFYSIQCATCKLVDSRKVPIFSVPDSTEIRALSVNVTNLEPFQEYLFQIQSKNSLSKIRGVKSSYETVKFTTAENPKIEIIQASINDDTVFLRWKPPMLGPLVNPNREYAILRVFKGQPSTTYVKGESFHFKGLEAGKHTFQVTFKDGSHGSVKIDRLSEGPYNQTAEDYKRLIFTVGVVLTVVLILVVACLTAVCCYRRSTYEGYKNSSGLYFHPQNFGGYPNLTPVSYNTYYTDMYGPNNYTKLPVGGAAFVDPSQAEPNCAEQIIGECGIHELEEERINYPSKFEFPACELKGSFGFMKGSYMDSNGSNFGANSGASSFVEVPVLIKKAACASSMASPPFSTYMAVGGLHPGGPAGVGVHGGSSDSGCIMNVDSRRVFLNEIAIAAQLSYDCNVLKLCGIVRKAPLKVLGIEAGPDDYPEYAVYENADTTLEHALLSNTLWQQQRKSMAMSATQQSLSASEFAPPCGVAGGAAGRGSPEVHIMRGIATGMQYLSELGYIHKVLRARNVYLTEEGTPKIAGFDHRVLLDEELMDSSIETKELWIEMLPWLSPEVLDCGKFSSASDVWSFGVLMWEIISQGDRPWAGKRPEEIQKAVFCGHKLPVNNTPCSMALYNLMMQCWEPDAKRRPTFAFLSQTFYHFIKQRDALAQQVGSTLPRSNRHLMDIDCNNYASGTLLSKNTTTGSFSSFTPQRQQRGLWTIEECLTQLKLPQYSAGFKNNGIHLLDDVIDRNMDSRTLKKLGVGNEKHRKQLLKYFEVVKQQQAAQLQQSDYQKSMSTLTIKPSPAVSIL